MIELLMVIILVGVLGAVALPQFLDFRKEGKAAALRQTLNAFRVGLKNQIAQAKLRCQSNPSTSDYEATFLYGIRQNDITINTGGYTTICTAANIPNAQDRKFIDFPAAELAVGKYSGFPITDHNVPGNPFIDKSAATIDPVCNVSGLTAANICAEASSRVCHWIYMMDKQEIYAGTNTTGINECNF